MTDYDFSAIVEQIATQEDIHNCQLKEISSSQKGDGYSGTVKAVKLIGTNKTLDVVFKYSHRDASIHEKLPIRDIYLQEITFYEQIVPAFASFQTAHRITNKYDNSPKYYGCIKTPFNELLVLENLKTQNYDMWDRRKLMNKEHLEYALNTFAKFHGTSFAMQKLDPALYSQISAFYNINDIFKMFFTSINFVDSTKKLIDEIIPAFDSILEKKYIEKLLDFGEKIWEVLNEVLDYRGHDVILQGDCWCNNAMYQYENLSDRSKPKNMKLLDLQAARLGPPCWDLAYFFYSIVPKELMDDLDYFLNFYYEKLREYLLQFKLNVEEIYSKDSFEKDWAVQSKYGLMVSFTVRKAMMSESQDAPDLAENYKDFMSAFKLKDDQFKVYTQQLKNIVMHFVDKKFI